MLHVFNYYGLHAFASLPMAALRGGAVVVGAAEHLLLFFSFFFSCDGAEVSLIIAHARMLPKQAGQ